MIFKNKLVENVVRFRTCPRCGSSGDSYDEGGQTDIKEIEDDYVKEFIRVCSKCGQTYSYKAKPRGGSSSSCDVTITKYGETFETVTDRVTIENAIEDMYSDEGLSEDEYVELY